MVRNKLTESKIKGLKKPGIFADGAGLYLRVHPGGSKSWFFIYSRNNVRRELGLGSFDGSAPVKLAVARKKADELREMLAAGVDPYAERASHRKSNATTFGTVALQYIEDKGDWKPHTEREWRRQLLEDCEKLKNVAINAVNTDLIEAVLRPIWKTKPATGQRIRSKLENVLDFATTKKLRAGDNPARWTGHLEHILAASGRVTGAKHAALRYSEVPALYKTISNDVTSRCLAFTILTAVRTTEARGALWSEFDMVEKTWTIPADRTKTGKELVVPLSEQAIASINDMKSLDRSKLVVFEGSHKDKPIGHSALRDLLPTLVTGATVHGMRSAFSDWAGDETEYPREIVEWSLGHQVGTAVERAYRRGDALKKRRDLMQAWADYVAPKS